MNFKKTLVVVLVVALLVTGLTACGKSNSDTIKIGGLGPLTGDVSVYGIAATNGVKLAIDEINKAGGINGKQIEFILYDEKGDVNEAVNAYNKLVDQDKVVAILGDVTSKPTISVAQLAAKANIPMVTATATALDVTKQGNNVFRACFIDPFQGEIMAKFAKENLKATKVAVIYNSSDDYSNGLKDSFTAKSTELGLQVVASESYTKGDTDFKAQLTKIAASGAEALFVPDYYNTVALIANQAKATGLTMPLMGTDGWDGVLSAAKPEDVEGYYFANHYSTEDQDPKVQNFLKNYTTTYKEDPNAFVALGYDAAYILADAIKKAGSTDSAKVIEALKATDYTGVTGNVKFDENRNPTKSVTIIQILDGQYRYSSKVNP